MSFNFDTLLTQLKSVAAYNIPIEFTNVAIMTGTEFHNNFKVLADGELDLNDRMEYQESLPKGAGSTVPGYVAYNGIIEQDSVLYGNDPLILPSVAIVTLPVNIDTSALKTFRVAVGDGIIYDGETLDPEATEWYEIEYGADNVAPFSYTDLPTLVPYLNSKLINNGNGFYLTGDVDLTSVPSWDSIFSWDVNPVRFYVSVDNGADVLVTLNTKVYATGLGGGAPNGPTGVVTVFNIALASAGLSTKVQASLFSGQYLRISGLNNRLNGGCSRFTLVKKEDELSQVLEQLGLLTDLESDKRAFDFSTTFQFVIRDTDYVDIEGNGPYSKILLLGGDEDEIDGNIFVPLALPIGTVNPQLYYHTSRPLEGYVSELNFGGNFHARKLGAIHIEATDDILAPTIEATTEVLAPRMEASVEIEAPAIVGTTSVEAPVIEAATSMEAPQVTASVNMTSPLFTPGSGIDFGSATPVAGVNTLDDYEEGTFSPAILFGGFSAAQAYSNRYARYTKIGNRVFFDIYILLSSKGTSTGSASINLPPFANNSGFYSAVTIGSLVLVTYTGTLTARIEPSGTTINLYETTEAGARTTITELDFGATSEICLSGSYSV